jgi:hypothetical protein
MLETVLSYEKMGYVAKLLKDGVCIGTWISFNPSNLLPQVEAWKLSNLK